MAFSTHDIVPDSPTNNFATFNPLDTGSSVIIANGNLLLSTTTNLTNFTITRSNMVFPKTGLYYFECYFISSSNGGWFGIDNGYGQISGNQNGVNNGTASIGRDGNSDFFLTIDSINIGKETHTSGTVIPVVWDADTNTIYTNHGVPSSSSLGSYTYSGVVSTVTGDFYPIAGPRYTTTDFVFNFGQDPTFAGSKSPTTTYTDANGIGAFYYEPPTGALALCTANLPEMTPDVAGDVPQDYFKAVIWTGTGYNRNITLGFQPDLVWVKSRGIAYGSGIYDSVRGAGANKELVSNLSYAEGQENFEQYDWVDSFDDGTQTGFSIDSQSSSNTGYSDGYLNVYNRTYVAWCWKAGGNSNTFNINGTGYSTYSALQTVNTSLPASSTSGMIVPSGMSINTDAGFSIVKYTGTGSTGGTVPHGLDKKPDIVIIKNLDDGTKSWNITSFITTPSTVLTANTFNIGSKTGGVLGLNYSSGEGAYTIDGQTSGSGQNHIAYCWHSVENYSKFGSYTGNGSADGPFVYCGFRPAFLLVKCYSATTNWLIYDNERSPDNVVNELLVANTSGVESGGADLDFTSNGFKWRSFAHAGNLSSGSAHLFMAFAEQPFKFSNAR